MNLATLHAAADDMAEFGARHVTAIDLERAIADKMRPLPRRFVVSVRRDGITTEEIVKAAEWFDAWDAALTKHGQGRIYVRPAA